MPLYEYHCLGCTLTFESLVSLSGARRSGTCPRCGRRSPRVTSAFAIAGRRGPSEKPPDGAAPTPKPEPPLCMRYPELPLLCHMDQKSAQRFVAHVRGRGAQFDETVAARAELRKKRGEPPQPAAPGHVHAHGHSHAGTKAHAHSHHHARHSH
jgi:putative FmdB family regulatory protein